MLNSRFLRKNVLFVLALMVSIGGTSFAADSSDELLNLIPADSIFAVRLNNFDLALNQLDSYLAGISPMPMGLSMVARMQFAGILGSPELKGVNTAGNFALYATAVPGQMQPAIKILVPVTDYDEFLSGNPNVGEADAEGISKVTINGMPLAVVKKAGNYAAFVTGEGVANFNVGNGLAGTIDTAEMALAVKKPIWAYANVQKVNEVYGAFVIEQLNKSKTMMADMKTNMETNIAMLENQKAQLDANDPNQKLIIEQFDTQIVSMKASMKQFENNPMADNMGNTMDMHIRMIETLLKETKSFSIAIEPKADVLTILETYTAMPGSDSAKVLVADTSGAKADKLINYLQDGAMLNLAGRLNKPLMQKFYSDGICLMGVMAAGKMSDQDIADMKEVTTDIIDSLGQAIALSLWVDKTASPPFMEDCIIEVSDAEKFNNTILKAIELWNKSGMMEFYKEMGLETNYITQMNVYQYKDAKVNSANLTFKATDPNSQEAQMIDKMYGDGFEYRWAVVDGLCVEAIAGDVDAAVKQLIDEVKAGGASEPAVDIKQAVAMLGEGADDFFGTLNIVRFLKMASAMQSFPMGDITLESKSNIAFGGKIADGKVVFKVAVPKTHVSEVMSIFMPNPAAK